MKSAFKILPPIKKTLPKVTPILKGYDISEKEIKEAWKEDKPIALSLFLGAKCNLRCLYCFTNGGKPTKNNLTEKEYKKVIDEAFKLGIKNVMLAGRGEPLLDPLIWELIKYIKNKNGQNIVLTNATVVTPKIAKKLYDLDCSVMTKINSFDPKIQDKLTATPGSAHKMYRGLRYLIDAGLNKANPTRLANDNLICKLTHKEMPFMIKYFTSHNIQPIFETILWKGRAIENIKALEISEKELKSLEKELQELGEKYSKGTYFKGEECIVDTITIILNERGDMLPCWARENLPIGNIRKSSLYNLWYKPELVQARKKHREIIQSIKKGTISPRECPGRSHARKLLEK